MDEIINEPEVEVTTHGTRSASSSLSEQEMIALEEEQYKIEEMEAELKDDQVQRPFKREREEEEEGGEEWTLVQNKEKKSKVEKIEIYLSSHEQMPKQFALAKLLKSEGLEDIERVKYINPFKIRLEVMSETSVVRIEKCKAFMDRGWRMQRAMEVNLCYGVIRDVDIDMTEEEIVKRIKCSEPGELVSASRLMRRNTDAEGWKPSESIRLCFRGSFRPASISVDGLRIKVDPYVFPVSQCTRCWKLGHATKKCPSAKEVCPKCTQNHQNCDTTVFKCVNCDGQHMALIRSCPAYQKERRLRELMAEYNCTYRRALTMYVPPRADSYLQMQRPDTIDSKVKVTSGPLTEITIPNQKQYYQDVGMGGHDPALPSKSPYGSTPGARTSFAKVVTTKATIHTENLKKPTPRSSKKQRHAREVDQFEFEMTRSDASISPEHTKEEEKKRDVTFSELLRRLREVLFLRSGDTIQTKVHNVIKCCIEWIILIAVENISDWPILATILEYFRL